MMLEALELAERGEMRVPVAERHDEAHRHPSAGGVVQEAAAVGVVGKRPAGRVQHRAGRVLRRIDLPDFLEAEAVVLRIPPAPQPEARLEDLAEMAAAAL